ncbi:hypothetical protein FA95DRAFT_1195525 [Auriscalpium vulgare]|uniref:Uncharacterized protein n=1 Tax=Auriscalpium vulgare TaxID=40419 RepID=A0ACB8RV77_9AGAM|nr:hypothetical protein FA95DRAFT_1195525 [Auriscalpium vulgare]
MAATPNGAAVPETQNTSDISSSSPQTHHSKTDLPPSKPKEDRGVRSGVSPPLSSITFNNFVHAISFVALLFVAWYTYRATTVAVATVKGGVESAAQSPLLTFIGLGSRKAPSASGASTSGGADGDSTGAPLSVEQRIEELAKALGVPSPDLSSAIAAAVREYVPPASLSSVAQEARRTGSSDVVEELVGGRKEEQQQGGGARGGVGGVAGTVGSLVGTDDVPGDW